MKQSNKTKKSLLASFMALVMCFSMFAGTTLAWFTDTATTGVQNIVTGKLDVDIVDANDNTLTKAPLSFVKAAGHETEEVLWEPGVTYDVEDFYIKNNGNLALKYKLYINGAVGDAKLLEAIDFTVKINGDEVKLNNFEGELLAGEKSGLVKVSAKMREEAGNVYQGLKLHGVGFTVYATQNDVEFDSFGNEYDKDSEYSVIKNPVNVFTTIPADIIGEDNKLTEDLEIVGPDGVTATIPAGTKIAEGAKHLNFTVVPMAESSSNIQLKETEKVTSVDVHIEGIAEDNETPISISLGNILSKGLNQGNYGAYHVENDVPEAMSENNALSGHNDFTYDPATGFVTIAIKSFSEIAVVADTENAWNGTFAKAFAGGAGTEDDPYIIANADQFAYFGDLISNNNENFGDKYYKLIADINLGGEEKANKGIIWYPIGYHKLGNPVEAVAVDDAPEAVYYGDEDSAPAQRPVMAVADGDTKWYTYGGAFKGTFDGNGHKISNIYQNTWQLKGNYDGHYWNAAMGVFGYVYGGTVKNLTVDNFSSDGEYTPTGVITAYAAGDSTFENIAITNCNPRVYNTGNGGIIGIAGNTSAANDDHITLKNITVDNSNKISALWGSWDVACGGLVGMFRGPGHVYMTNCHVAAQIDVYNDVCGNYQYYWYRYAGMMIGTNKTMITDENGYTVPETEKFHASGCTVHFGEWNNYWYCELVANTLASYTHDHQFSRLEQISSLDEIKSGDTWTKTGNFLLINGDTKTCYHIVNKDGVLTQHKHEDAGEETVNGVTVLKEDKQIVYLPFNQLFTGYGWGVKHVPISNDGETTFAGVTILDGEPASSVKFKANENIGAIETETTVSVGELFVADVKSHRIKGENVQVTVSPVGEGSTVSATYTANTADWKQGELTFAGVGTATVTITDYYFCIPTIITVIVKDHDNVDKFKPTELKTVELFEVVPLGGLFEDAGSKIGIKSQDVVVTVSDDKVAKYTPNTTDWTNGTIEFIGCGEVTITITDNYYCNPTEITVNVPVPDDITKFKAIAAENSIFAPGSTLTIDKLFEGCKDIPTNFAIDTQNVQVTVSPVGEGSTAAGTYTPSTTENWEDGTLTFTGVGTATVTITDDYYCKETKLNIEIAFLDKFESNFTGNFLYRVGNQNAVALGSLFKEISTDIVNDSTVSVKVESIKGNATGEYTSNATWTNGTIKFSGTGVVKVTIYDNESKQLELTLEVVDATNLTSATGTTTGGTFVLLCDVNTSTYVNYWNCTLYGNGFTYSLKGAPTAYNSKQGHGVIITKNATLDNLVIVGDVYNSYGAYTNQDYYNTAIDVADDTTIQNCYIANCAAPVSARDNVNIINTTLYGGTVANLIISAGTATLENVTTANYDDGRAMVGMGIVIHSDATETAKLVLNGTLTQYNFISESKVPTDTYAKNLHSAMFGDNCSQYHFGTSPNRYVNTGIISLTSTFNGEDITDNAKTGYVGKGLKVSSYEGYVYTQPNTSGSVNNNFPKYKPTTQGAVPPSYSFDYTNKNYVAKTDGSNDYCYEENGKVNISMDQGDTFNWDTSILTIGKGITDYTVSMNGTDYTGKSIAFNKADNYTVTYTYTDGNNYKLDENGNITAYSVTYTKTVNITVAVVKATTKHAEFTFGSSNTASTTVTVGNSTYVMPNVSGTSGTIGSTTVDGKTIYYPIVEIIMSDGKTSHSSGWYAYFPVFSGAVTITDYANNGTGDKMTPYNGSTTTMPSGLSIVGDPGTLFKYQSKTAAGTTPVVNSNKLVYSSAKIEADRSEYNTVIQYSYTDNAGATYYYYIGYHAPAQKYSPSCVTPETLITLADGTQKEIQYLTGDEMLLAWNHETKAFVSVPTAYIVNHDETDREYEVITLVFSDGSDIEIIGEHVFFDATLNKYVTLNNNAEEFIGHKFLKASDDYNKLEKVKLVKVEKEIRNTKAYEVVTYKTITCFTDDILSASAYLDKILNVFDINPLTYGYNMRKVQKDIETYGLYTYDDFEGLIDEKAFDLYNAAYLKVAVGKGYITWNDILNLIDIYFDVEVKPLNK